MEIIDLFNTLESQDDHLGVISLLQQFKESRELTVEELGWVYWNVSDRYALLRNAEYEYANHIEFVKWGVDKLSPDKLHWFVSDATQALTLSLGGYFDRWTEWYLYACSYSPKLSTNRGVRFESHRAIVCSLLQLKNSYLLDTALNHMKQLMAEDIAWENAVFSQITYYTLLLERHDLLAEYNKIDSTVSDLHQVMDDRLFHYSNDDTDPCEYVLGSWDQLNQPRNSHQSLLVALNNLGCTLNRVRKYHESATVFEMALKNGHTLNNYGMAMYLSSLWNHKKDKNEISECLNNRQNNLIPITDVLKFAPELKEALGE